MVEAGLGDELMGTSWLDCSSRAGVEWEAGRSRRGDRVQGGGGMRQRGNET